MKPGFLVSVFDGEEEFQIETSFSVPSGEVAFKAVANLH